MTLMSCMPVVIRPIGWESVYWTSCGWGFPEDSANQESPGNKEQLRTRHQNLFSRAFWKACRAGPKPFTNIPVKMWGIGGVLECLTMSMCFKQELENMATRIFLEIPVPFMQNLGLWHKGWHQCQWLLWLASSYHCFSDFFFLQYSH